MEKTVEILSLCICYKNELEVLDYCKMINKLPQSEKVAISVVINSLSDDFSSEEFKQQVQSISDNYVVYNPGENLGYLNGLKKAYSYFMKNHACFTKHIRWCILSNTDIRILSEDFINYILTNKNFSSKYVYIAPQISRVNPKGYECHTKKKISHMKMHFLYYVNHSTVSASIYYLLANIRKHNQSAPEYPEEVYAAHGSFFLLSNEYMKYLMQEEWPFLMYNEEGFVSYVVEKNGGKGYYDPHIKIEHTGSTTTSLLSNRKKTKMMRETYKFLIDYCYS